MMSCPCCGSRFPVIHIGYADRVIFECADCAATWDDELASASTTIVDALNLGYRVTW